MMSYDYPHPVSRTYQYKKITKPLLERKRRARINRCLDELKDLMVDALETEGEDISKLEKADILELTVRHLQRLQASRPSGLSNATSKNEEVSAESRWLSGFGHCAAEACRFLSGLPGEAAERLAKHLATGLQTNRQSNPPVKASLLSPALASLERTANFVSPCAASPSNDVTRATPCLGIPAQKATPYPEINVAAENTAATPISGPAIVSQRDANENQENELETNPKTKMKPSRDRSVTTTKSKTDGMKVSAEDDEEIDVERVDEADPMWRPW